MYEDGAWVMDFPVSITVVDADGRIVEMNQKACETFAKEGGVALVGTDVFACHPESAQAELRRLFETQVASHYTIQKGGRRKIIHQIPWYRGDVFAGLVEISIPIPDELPHFDRDKTAP